MGKRSGGRFDLLAEFGDAGRRLVLVDVENFLGRRYITDEAARWAAARLRELLGLRVNDLVVVGTSHTANRLAAQHEWTTARHVSVFGHDGADQALLAELTDDIAARFTEVVIVSGDGIFAETLAALALRRIVTTVVSRSESLAARLRLAAQNVICPTVEFFGPTTEGMVA